MTLCADWCDVEDVIGTGDSGGLPCGPCANQAGDPYDETVVADAISFASEVLYGLTDGRYPGECSQTVRPCGSRLCSLAPLRYLQATGSTWNGHRCACRPIGTQCGCSALRLIELPGWPVVEVTEVLVDGVALDPTAYRIDEQRYLVRLDGDGWPACQNMAAAATEADTFQVTFVTGPAPPPGGVISAALFACELVKGWCGQECEIPDRAVSISRQGATINLEGAGEIIAQGRTGITAVDEWIRSITGGERQAPALIASPDVARLAWRPGG